MVNVQNLNQIISELQFEADKIKSVRLLLQEVQKMHELQYKNEEKYESLINEINYLEEMLNDNINAYKKNITLMKNYNDEWMKNHKKLSKDVLQNHKQSALEVEETLKHLIGRITDHTNKINDSFTQFITSQHEINDDVMKYLRSTMSENTKLFIDIKDYISAKIETGNNEVKNTLYTMTQKTQEEIIQQEEKRSHIEAENYKNLISRIDTLESDQKSIRLYLGIWGGMNFLMIVIVIIILFIR